MKLFALIAVSLAVILLARGEDQILNFKTTDGREFKNVTLSSRTPAAISVMTESGVEAIPLGDLPAEMQKRFGYDPKAAALYLEESKKIAASNTKGNALKDAAEARFAPLVAAVETCKTAKIENGTDAIRAEKVQAAEDILAVVRSMIEALDRKGVSLKETKRIIDAVIAKKVFVGMPAEFVKLAWGYPRDLQVTLSNGGKTEHWHYRTAYVSISDGAVDYISADQ